MADVKISNLPEVTSLNTTDVAPFVASGTTSKITLQNIAATMPQVSSSISASYALNGGPISISGSSIYSNSPLAGPGFSTNQSIFLGSGSGYQATYSEFSVFLGNKAGYQAYNALYSNFIGVEAGYQTNDTYYSNFLGFNAGYQATDANFSNFLGQFAGAGAINASYSNFLGAIAGNGAQDANNSNFLGYRSGYNAKFAYESNFLGSNSGTGAISASYSNLFGYQVGSSPGFFKTIGRNNIIIGTNITLENDRKDSINLGGIIFATGSYFNPFGDTLSGSVGNGRVGINQPLPQYSLDVSGSGNYTNGLTVTGSFMAQNVTASNALFTGNITAQTLIVQTVSSSVIYSSGSNIFGDDVTDVQQMTGSVRITGSLTVNGPATINNLTGSLFGTASWALNVPASGVVGLNLSQISSGSVSASVNINSASFQVVSGSTNLLFVSNSGLITAQRLFLSSSRNMASGSTLVVFGSGSAQPVFTVQGSQGELFSVNDSLSGSLFSVNDISGLPIIEAFSDNRVLIGSYQAPMLTTTVRTTLAVGNNMIYQNVPTASYDAVFFEYSLKSGSNARAGSIMGIWSGSDANYNETVTVDFGDTTGVKFMVMVTGSNVALTGSATTANWTMKTIIRSI